MIVVATAAVFATALALENGAPIIAVVVAWMVLLVIALLETVLTARSIEWRAETTEPAEAIDIVRTEVAELSDDLEVRQPGVALLDRTDPTAMIASVPGFSKIYVSTGLFEAATPDERRALLAHELAHASHRDGLPELVSSAVSNAVGLVVFWWWAVSGATVQIQLTGIVAFQALYLARNLRAAYFLMNVLGGLTPFLVSVAFVQVRRYQEYRADATAASLVEDPRRVVRALTTLTVRQRKVTPVGRLHQESASSETGSVARVLSSHPPHSQRVDRLLATAEGK